MATMINRAGTIKFDLDIEESDRELDDNDCQVEEEICPDRCSECSEDSGSVFAASKKRRRSSNIPSYDEVNKAE